MTRSVAILGIALLVFVAHPPGTHPRTGEASSSSRPLHAQDGTDRPTATERSTPSVPDRGRSRPSRDPNLPRATPRLSLSPDDGGHRARLDRAIERFTRAGLRLPDLHVAFTDDGCQGHLGLFDRDPTPWRVEICSDLEFVLTHELAHAWATANLDAPDRVAYTAFRGLAAWHNPDAHWRDRGTEDAAFVMQQVLMTTHIRPDSSVWIERSEAYEQLTGEPPPQALAIGEPTSDPPATASPAGSLDHDIRRRTSW